MCGVSRDHAATAGSSIAAAELQELLAAGRPVTVLDIRRPSDREWSIPGSVAVDAYDAVKSGSLGPLADYEFGRGPVVTVCGVGATASIASRLLRAAGVDAVVLEGGMKAWSAAWNAAQLNVSGCEVIQVRRTGKGCLSYLVESDGQAVVIDASSEPDVYVKLLHERGWRLAAVVDTHIHADHLSRSRLLAAREGVEICLPAQERTRFEYRPLAGGDRVGFGSAGLVALPTPGHTSESTTYLLDAGAAFTGDTLFLGGVGRPDLEGARPEESASRARQLHQSIQRLMQLSAATVVLPGHASEPIPFDGQPLTASLGSIRDMVALTRFGRAEFIQAVLARLPASPPPHHSHIVELNERGEIPEDPSDLEAGANRCAVA